MRALLEEKMTEILDDLSPDLTGGVAMRLAEHLEVMIAVALHAHDTTPSQNSLDIALLRDEISTALDPLLVLQLQTAAYLTTGNEDTAALPRRKRR